ncbi:MAG TPA: hypothetical protein VE944_21065 [Nostoc sp.]|uniref:hypothetical protein n=1 Tax=Nostoc sp. TaxID=1180 RepID=UPI002D4E4006|nr:hypothetical protein [Nostoc sp.]HYX16791.1 hypothetical protein [Nostoc sp.]
MSSLWDWLFNDVDWHIVSDKGRKLGQAARRNLITTSAICAIAGSFSAGVGLVGSYSPRATYCDNRTKPCTKVEVNSFDEIPVNVNAKYLPGYGLQRTAGSILAVLLFGGGLFAIAKAEEEQEEIEPQLQLDKQLAVKRLELEANTEFQNLENLAQTRVEVHEQELKESVAEMFFERNPEAIAQYLPKSEPVLEQSQKLPEVVELKVSEPEPEPEPELFFGVELPKPPALGVEFWDWQWFNNRIDDLPHIRLIAPTNGGKTTLCDWLVDVVPSNERMVLTVKRKPHQWAGLPVYGVPEAYGIIREKLEWLQDERIERTRLMEKGVYRGRFSAIVDEWKAIARNIKAIKDPETKEIISPSAKEIMGEQLTLSRESLIRIFAMAQGRQVITWGLEGESDILECFCTVYLGSFAVEEAETMQRKFAKDSEEWAAWGKVVEFLRSLGKRAAWIECEFGKFPAIAPDLSGWKREVQEVTKPVDEIALDIIIQPHTIEPTITDIDDPEELLRLNIDRLMGNFERSFAQSPILESGNLKGIHPEFQETEEQSESILSEPTEQALLIDAASVPDEKRYTPLQLTKAEIIATVSKMQLDGVSQTKIVGQLWQVKKSRSGWSKAYREFRGLGF